MANQRLPQALTTTGYSVLALGGIMALLSLTAGELENATQATGWSTGGFITGLAGALLAAAGAFLGMKQGSA